MGILKRPPAPMLRGSSASYGGSWRTFSPVVYRYLEREYVDAFFNDGSLRLSSLTKCKKHTDEQRLDLEEGTLRLALTSIETGALKSLNEIELRENAYLLCTTLWHNNELMQDFECDSYIRIHDPAEFGMRISKHIRGFQKGGEGPCMYQHLRIIEASLSENGELNASPSDEARKTEIAALIQQYALFLKHKAYSHQAEYRLIWFTDDPEMPDYLDVKVPEVRELCSREGMFELETFGQPPATR